MKDNQSVMLGCPGPQDIDEFPGDGPGALVAENIGLRALIKDEGTGVSNPL